MLIKMMNAALSSNELEDWEKGECSCLSLHDLVLFSASHCTKTACYFNCMFFGGLQLCNKTIIYEKTCYPYVDHLGN